MLQLSLRITLVEILGWFKEMSVNLCGAAVVSRAYKDFDSPTLLNLAGALEGATVPAPWR